MARKKRLKGEVRSQVAPLQRSRAKSWQRGMLLVLPFVLLAALWASKITHSQKIATSPREGRARHGIRYAMRDGLELTEPALVRSGENALWISQVCEGLVRFSPDSVEVEPALAERYAVSADGKEWTFFLRKGVKFHDDTVCNARAVHFCFMRLLDPNNPYHVPGMLSAAREIFGDERDPSKASVRDIQVVDDYTLKILFSQPDAGLLRRLARVEAAVMSPPAIRTAAADGQTTIVGTGPMKVASLQPGTAVVLERNEQYWGERASVSRLQLRCIPDNHERERALREGLCDLAQRFSPTQLDGLRKDARFTLARGPSLLTCIIVLNTEVAPLDQPAVRQSLSAAIDRRTLAQTALHDYARPAMTFFPPALGDAPTSPLLSETAQYEKARQLLDAAGLGKGFSIKLLLPKEERIWNPIGASLGDHIASSWRRINVSVVSEALPSEQVRQRVAAGDFQAAVWGVTAASGELTDFLSAYEEVVGDRVASTPLIVSLHELAAASRKSFDRKAREEAHNNLATFLLREMPWIPLFTMDQVIVARRGLIGLTLNPVGQHRLWNLEWQGD